MKLYSYDGPVLEFDRVISDHWKASTYAKSEAKARSNLAYQFKKQYAKEPRSKISVTGKLITAEGDDDYRGRI